MRPDTLPTAVHACWATGLVGSCVKMRNDVVNWSATFSPRPEPGTELFSVSVQFTSVPLRLDELLLMRSVQFPSEPWFLNALRGSWGVNVPVMPTFGWVAA